MYGPVTPQVRAGNLQELVYKQGQTGVVKASVSITFDNSDESQSPVGYSHMKEITVTRQVVIGGRNKYLVNGHVATATTVQNLFHSVQLNVNNPHFLIMQVRLGVDGHVSQPCSGALTRLCASHGLTTGPHHEGA